MVSARPAAPAAKAARTRARMLLHYFEDKAGLVAAALTLTERLTMRRAGRTEKKLLPPDTCRPAFLTILLDDDLRRYIRIWLEMLHASKHRRQTPQNLAILDKFRPA